MPLIKVSNDIRNQEGVQMAARENMILNLVNHSPKGSVHEEKMIA